MPIADSKKQQTFLNVLAEAAEAVRRHAARIQKFQSAITSQAVKESGIVSKEKTAFTAWTISLC